MSVSSARGAAPRRWRRRAGRRPAGTPSRRPPKVTLEIPRDEIFNFRDVALLRIIFSLLLVVPNTTFAHIRIIIARVIIELLRVLVQPHDVRADAVHEVLRVRHEEQYFRPPREVVLEPKHGLHVQMIRGFI